MTQTTSQVEAAAKLIYETWKDIPEYRLWQNGGNSLKQDEARRIARQVIELASQQEVAEGDYKNMWLAAVSTLAKIDALLGLPEDGCNDPDYTLSALQDYMAGVAEVTRTDVPYTLDDVRAWIKQGQDRAASQQEVAAPCPNCDGTGSITVPSDNGPDAYDMEVDCPHCGGKQTLEDAYHGVKRRLEAERASHQKTYSIIWGHYGTVQAEAFQRQIKRIVSQIKPENLDWLRDRLNDLAASAEGYLAASRVPVDSPADSAYREAVDLATSLFKKHYAHEDHYASGKVVWGPCDTTAGVISQIDNMVTGLSRTPPVGAGGAGVMDARPETMEIRYETFGNCLWHTDCKVNSFKSGVMQVLSHEKTSSTMKCLSCGQVGAYPKGRVGTVCVPVISTDAAILASKGGDQGEGK